MDRTVSEKESSGGDWPLVSIIVPVYNQALYISRCIDSITHQTYAHLEIIIVNDGSTDDTEEIAQALAQHDARTRVITQTNQGVSAARNTGVNSATGDYLMFVDGDDWIDNTTIAICVGTLQQESCDMVRFGCVFEYGYKQRIRSLAWKVQPQSGLILFKRMFSKIDSSLLSVWGALYQRELITPTFVEGMRNLEDVLYIASLYAKNPRVFCLGEPLYHYRADVSGASATYHPEQAKSLLALESGLVELIRATPVIAEDRPAIYSYLAWGVVLTLCDAHKVGKLTEALADGDMAGLLNRARKETKLPLPVAVARSLFASNRRGLLRLYLSALNIGRAIRKR